MSPRVWFGFSIVALGWHAGSSSAQSVRTYRYELITISGESQFSGQPRPLLRGDAYRVQKDSLDRIVQTSHLENGKLVDRTVYHYAATEMLPDSYRFFEGDSLSAKVTIKRNTKGDRIRIESFEPSDESAQLTVNTIKGDIIEAFDSVTTPSSWLHLTGSTISHFSPRGLLVRRETHAGAVLDREVLYDEIGRAHV